MSNKYYAVKVGKKPGIYNTWDECKEQVNKFPGAIYKSFKTMEEAKKFILLNLDNKEQNNDSSNISTKLNEKTSESFLADEGLTIYVDGSFSLEKKNFSYGLVAIDNGKVIYEDKGIGFDEKAVPLRNVSGEVLGAMKAVEYAIEKGYEKVTIVFDYQGIESWALGIWKRNNEITSNYNKFMQEKMKEIKISFKKVKGHSGDKFNDRVDSLAKEALGIK